MASDGSGESELTPALAATLTEELHQRPSWWQSRKVFGVAVALVLETVIDGSPQRTTTCSSLAETTPVLTCFCSILCCTVTALSQM